MSLGRVSLWEFREIDPGAAGAEEHVAAAADEGVLVREIPA
jgi:hypothetical protein